ncbi:MAG: EAL domain-containing protein [Paracoccaceae bacterium]
MDTERSGLLSRFAENVPGAAFLYGIKADGTDTVRFLNEACEEIWGVSPDDIQQDPSCLWEMIHVDDLADMQSSVAQSAERLTHWDHRFRITDAKGQQKHLLGRGTPERLPDGGVTWLTFIFDVTAQVAKEIRIATVTDQLNVVSAAIPDAFALFDQYEHLVICNDKFREVYALAPDEDLSSISYKSIVVAAAAKQLFPAADGREEEWVEETLSEFRRADVVTEVRYGATRWLRHVDRPTSQGGRVAFRIDITKSKAHQAELERAASTDALTGLLNRRGLSGHLLATANHSPQEGCVALLNLDLDKFKTINDALGHEAGDLVLKKVADRLRRCIDKDGHIARVGGDEFVIAIRTDKTDEEITQMAEEIRSKVIEPILSGGRVCQVGASIGLSIWRGGDAETVEQALLDADTALMQSKALGRNRTVAFCPEMRHEAVEIARIAAQIKQGLAEEQFVPFFQPQIEMPGGALSGLETLVRWRNASGACLPAGAFIEVANETGLIGAIDRRMVRGSLGLLKELRAAGLPDPRVSVNFSSAQLRDPSIVERVLDELFAHGIAAEQVNVEILESTLLDDRSDLISSNIRALAQAGFRIELDDFGTGHTALASLQQFPVHQIKIDRSLIKNVDSEPATRAITEGIFALCRKLGIDAIAEGVETEAELATLMKIGLRHFQGYLFAKPMSCEELMIWLEAHGHFNAAGSQRRVGPRQD